ncbi:MAG TPA: CtsR family transcriptional regulator, partial [Symbiobacteriaceae bacterium]|nr:CtsR family transcriptional regulator [Symbiobacteriaceae bacterium]
LHELVHRQIGPQLSQDEATGYIARLRDQGIINEREAAIMLAAINREAIGLDLPLRDLVRANLLKAMILAVLRY